MFRFDTSVRVLIATLAMGFTICGSSVNATETATTTSERDCTAEVTAIENAQKALDEETMKDAPNPGRVATLTKRLSDAEGRYAKSCGANTNDPADCEQAKGKYSTAKGALSAACLTLGGGNTGTDSGWPLCTLAINQCDQCPAKGGSSNPNVTCDDITVEEEESQRPSTTGSTQTFGLRDLKTGNALLKYCPGKLGADQKDLEKQMQESQKEVRRLEGELPKLQAEYTELVSATETAVSEIQDQMTEAQTKLDEDLEAAQNAQDDAVKALQEKITGIEEQIARADDNIRQVQLSKTDAENAYNEAIKNIDLQCHASATQTVSKYQQDRLQLERAKQFNRVSFNNVMKQVGVSDRDQWQRVANKYYQWCLQSFPTKDAKVRARTLYNTALTKADEAIAKIERDKVRLRDAIKKVQSDNGCNPAQTGPQNGETDMCRAMRMAKQASERLMKQYNTKMNQLNRKVGEEQRKGAAKAQAKLAEANLIQQQLAEERTRLQNLKQYLELAYQAGGGGTAADAKSYTEAKSKYGDFVASASVLVACNPKAQCDADTACMEASNFLTNIQAHPGYKDEMAREDTMAPLFDEDGKLKEGSTCNAGGKAGTIKDGKCDTGGAK